MITDRTMLNIDKMEPQSDTRTQQEYNASFENNQVTI